MLDREKPITIALVGNPNSGKTTLFNQLTGHRQHVGNYPGVTVEKKEGYCIHHGYTLHVIDLPGTYSLTARSLEERITRDFILDEKPDILVDILDASNIERNLYLYTQLMELNVPMVLALNMSDQAQARGIEFDLPKLSQLLGVPIVPTVGHKNEGLVELVEQCIAVASGIAFSRPVPMNLGKDIENEIEKIQGLLAKGSIASHPYPPRWLAMKLLERDTDLQAKISSPEIRNAIAHSVARIEQVYGDPPEIVIADQRYGIISGACQEAICLTVEARHTYSDKIDEILTNRIFGLPIFLGLMYLVFQFTFTLGHVPVSWLESGFVALGNVFRAWEPSGSENILLSLIVDGIIGGVGGVVVFVPNIFMLFLAIAFLEDTGYMARAAFNMDRFMHKIGLHGKSFIPMLIGFGCSVPAIMATRTLENPRDRYTTMMVIPLMSCGARLPIYTLIIPAFFPPAWQAPLLWLMYLIGAVLAIGGAKLLRSTLFKGENDPFIMELPPYRLPTWKGLAIHVCERTWLYLKKAGTVILGFSILLWALMSFPEKTHYARDYQDETIQIENTYRNDIEQWNRNFHLSEDSSSLENTLRRWVENGDSIHTIPTPSDRIARLIHVCETIQEIRTRFQASMENENVEKHSLDEALLIHKRDTHLAEIAKTEPELYPAAIRFLDEIQRPFTENKLEIERSKHAERLAFSMAGRFGQMIEPILRPIGFDWKIGVALIGAFAAKEVFVAQLGIVYSLGEAEEHSEALRSQLQEHYTPLSAFCIMLFCLIAMPCMATIATTRFESGSWKWAFLQLSGLTVTGYAFTLLVYQFGKLMGIGI